MILKQYYLACLSHASYLLADPTSGRAVVVDPQRDVQGYLQDAQQLGVRITHVFLTHFHADFLAGHLELRSRVGARIVMGPKARADFELDTMHDGESLDLGEVRLQVLETPGHTPEGICVLVFDKTSSDEQPHAVLTGDTLFIGDVGRPDLLASVGVSADALADMLYHSVRRLATLPEETLVYPAHGAGSMCGKNLSKETVSTLGAQKRTNYALQIDDVASFKALVTAEQPQAPAYFLYDAVKNRREYEVLDEVAVRAARPLLLEEVLAHIARGALVLDVRDAESYARGHLRGAVQVGLGGQFATWCGTVVSPETPLIVMAEDGAAEEAITRLGRIGYDTVLGVVAEATAVLAQRPDLVAVVERLAPEQLQTRMQAQGPTATPGLIGGADTPLGSLPGERPFQVLDVRTASEYAAGHLEGSLHIPLQQLADRLGDLPTDKDLVVHCQGGYRSMIALSLLERAGFEGLTDLRGGYKAWETAGGACVSQGPASTITCTS